MTRPETGRVALEQRRSPGAPAPHHVDRDLPAGVTVEPGIARIAVDLLGGDHAPAVVVDGALRACQADPALHLLLVGPPEVAGEIFAVLDPAHHGRVSTAADGGESSITTAVVAVVEGRADAVVSAGPTGATVTAAALGFGRWPGLRRPALAAVLPTAAGRVLLLDVGATVNPDTATLAGHAVLGAAYAAAVHALTGARVGLLTIGTEDGKGDRLRRAAAPVFADLKLPAGARYVGLVEGHAVVSGEFADVVVTDGFTGNVLLKGIEAAYALLGDGLPLDAPPRAATLLGVGGTVVVCHGAATGLDVASGIALAARLYRHNAIPRLTALLPTIEADPIEAAAPRETRRETESSDNEETP